MKVKWIAAGALALPAFSLCLFAQAPQGAPKAHQVQGLDDRRQKRLIEHLRGNVGLR